MTSQEKTIDIGKWLNKTLLIDEAPLRDVQSFLLKAIKKQGFKISEHNISEENVNIRALFGSKLLAFLMGLIPFGTHLPSGKRFRLQASIKAGKPLKLDISITPHMELLASEEIGGITQSPEERASDEYIGAKKIWLILRSLHYSLKIPPPDEYEIFDTKSFARDTFWGLLIYHLDSYKSRRKIHIAPKEKAPFCWGGLILPEFWFVWHDIWGVELFFGLPTLLYIIFEDWGWPDTYGQEIKYTLITLIILMRIILGFWGNKIFYAKYGYYPNEKDFRPSTKGPVWNWKSFLFPEFWFLWNELIFAAFIVIGLDIGLIYLNNEVVESELYLALFIIIRLLMGIKGNKIYYAKHGSWPN